MARSAETLVSTNVITSAVNKINYKDGSNNPLTNAYRIRKVCNLSTGVIKVVIDLDTAAAPASSGTRYAAYAPGSTATDIVAGKLYIKTSAVGAADFWAVVGAQT